MRLVIVDNNVYGIRDRREVRTMEELTTNQLRRRLGEVFDRVQYGGKRYLVKRKGNEIGAIVPVEVYRELERAARKNLVRFLDDGSEEPEDITTDALMQQISEIIEQYRALKRETPAD
jgi:prevent-host-death family protein